MKRFASLLFADFHWKLISLGLAFLLWLFGTNMANPTQNHLLTVQLDHHSLEILANEDIILVNPEALDILVQVGVRAPRSDLAVLIDATPARQAAMIAPSVDFRAVNVNEVRNNDGTLTVRLNINVNLYPGYEHFSITPSFIEVEVDAVAREIFPVELDDTGDVDSGLELRTIRLANNNVTVTGTRTNIAQVDRVRVHVDIWGINYDTELPNLRLEVIDRFGHDITHLVQLSVQETTATVLVWPIKTIALRVEPTGTIAHGFAVDEIDTEPRFIDVIGAPSTFNELELEYVVVELDLDNRNESFIDSLEISEWLPNGVFLSREQDPVVAVVVAIEPIERRVFQIPFDNLLIRGVGVLYDIVGSVTTVRLSVDGPQTKISGLSQGDIGLELDLRNLSIGIHRVPLTVNLPDGVTLALNPPMLQVQIHEPAGADTDEDYNHYNWEDPGDVEPEPPAPIEPNGDIDNGGDDDYGNNDNNGEYYNGDEYLNAPPNEEDDDEEFND